LIEGGRALYNSLYYLGFVGGGLVTGLLLGSGLWFFFQDGKQKIASDAPKPT